MRPLSYDHTDVFFICFSMIDPKSFNHALNKWLPEVHDHCPHALKVFIGTKTDMYREEQELTKLNKMNVRRRPIILP